MSNFQILLNAAQFLSNSSSWVKHLGRCMRSHKNMPAFHAIRELRCSKSGNSHDLDVAIMAIMARNIQYGLCLWLINSVQKGIIKDDPTVSHR